MQQVLIGAGNEARTRYLHLGKVALYRMSYARISKGYITTNRRKVKKNFLKNEFRYFEGRGEVEKARVLAYLPVLP